jgi:hypothetical protein
LLCQLINENYTDSSVSSTTVVTHTTSLSYMALLQDGTTCPYCDLKIFKWQYKKTNKNGQNISQRNSWDGFSLMPPTRANWSHV